MDAVKSRCRKPNDYQVSAGDIVELGGMATPPSYPPLAYHTESDMRSMPNDFLPPHQVVTDQHHHREAEYDTSTGDITPSDEGTLDHPSQHEQQKSPTYPEWTPINDPSARPRKLPLNLNTFSLRNGYTVTNAELRMNEIFEDETEDIIDKQDGLVYHKSHKYRDHDGLGTSYSFVWVDDDPEMLPLQVQQWKDRRTKAQRFLEGPALENAVRNMLETGSALVLERTGAFEDGYECLLPECSYTDERLPPGHFYLRLRPGRQAWPLPKPFFFCLACFERLWMGEFTQTPGPPGIRLHSATEPNTESQPAETKPHDDRSDSPLGFSTPYAYTNELALDGTTDSLTVHEALQIPSLCSSRHAPPELADKSSSPLPRPLIQEPPSNNLSPSSPSSITSHGDCPHPPTPLQHLSPFLKPGPSLSALQTAALHLWKLASSEQLQWEPHLQRTRYRRAYQEGGETLVDKSLHMMEEGEDFFRIEDVDGEVVDEGAAEAIVGVGKRRFRGCSLGDVWLVLRNEGV